MEEHVFVISGNTVRGIYKDAVDLRALGHVKITRAGNVEWNEARQGFEVSFPDGTYICKHLGSGRLACEARLFDTYEAAVAAEEVEVKRRLLTH